MAVTGRGEPRLRAFAEELGNPDGLLTFVGNAAEYGDIKAAVDGTLKEFGRLDSVVANAGFATQTPWRQGTPPAGPRWC